jgi:uncharacterized OB-fold protein
MSGEEITAESFYKFAAEKKLMGSKCSKCGAIYLPPRPICNACNNDEMNWVEMSGKGTIAAFTIIAVGPIPMTVAGYDKDKPYCSGLIKMEEGMYFSAQIIGVDTAHPESIKIGTPVTVDFLERPTWHILKEIYEKNRIYPVFKV